MPAPGCAGELTCHRALLAPRAQVQEAYDILMGRIEAGGEGEVQGAGGSRKWYKAYKQNRAGGGVDRPADMREQWKSQMSGLRARSNSRTAKGWGAAAAAGPAGPAGPAGQTTGATGRGGATGTAGRGSTSPPPSSDSQGRVGKDGIGATPGSRQGRAEGQNRGGEETSGSSHEEAHSMRRQAASGAQGRAHVLGQMDGLRELAEDRADEVGGGAGPGPDPTDPARPPDRLPPGT